MNIEPDADSDDQNKEDEIDPIEAVRRAVESTDETDFEDGHELKQLIKNANGVTLPKAGKFLLKALRSDEAPISREGSDFVVAETEETETEKSEKNEDSESESQGEQGEKNRGGEKEESKPEAYSDKDQSKQEEESKENTEEDGEETVEPDTSVYEGYSALPDELKELGIWSVREDEEAGTDTVPDELGSFDDIVEGVNEEDPEVGYINTTTEDTDENNLTDESIITVRIKGCLNEDGELDEWVSELPIYDEYVEVSPSRDGCSIPVVGYKEPEWWEDTYLRDDEEKGIELVSEGFVECTGKLAEFVGSWEEGEISRSPGVKHGGREIDAWLAQIREEVTGEGPLETVPVADADIPPVDGVKLTDEQIKECLEYIDPDIPYPEWKRIGYALVDNYTYDSGEEDQVEKAQRVFDAWSRRGSKYGNGAKRYFGNIVDGGPNMDITVGYLIHRACQEGWVWEADNTDEEDSESEDYHQGDEVHEVTKESPGANFDEKDGCYGYWNVSERGNRQFTPVTNFKIETQRRIKNPEREGKYLELTVDPQNEEEYDILVESKAFNAIERFKDEVVTGFTTRFDGNEEVLNDIRERVGKGEGGEPTEGTDTAGLRADNSEFVTPEGTLTEYGWCKDPGTVFVKRMTDFEHRWNLSQDEDGDGSDVAKVLELLPEIRQSEKFLTVLGWFYAAPLKPLLVEWDGEFPVLSVTGGTESGKESTLRVLQRAFGTDGEPLYVNSEPRAQLENLSSSRSVPLWYDGYHPSSIRRERTDSFHDYCRKTTRCMDETAHEPDGSRTSYRLSAPVVVTGEEIQSPYLAERSMVTEFETRTVEERRESRRKYAELVGESYYGDDGEPHHPDGLSLGSHAKEYYSWIAGQEKEELKEEWQECRYDAESVITSRGVDSLRGTELQGVRVTLFGLRMYQTFAEEMGAEPVINAKAKGKEREKEEEEDAELLRTAQEEDD